MQTIVNLGTGGADLNGRNGSTASADSNDALFLDWPGDNAGNYVYLPGVASNFLSVPDEAALDITGDIDCRLYVKFESHSVLNIPFWKPNAYEMRLNTNGTINFRHRSAAVTLSRNSTAAVPYSAGEAFWMRATLDVNNGASGHTVTFYTSDDGQSWTQLGAPVVNAGVVSIDTSNDSVSFGQGYSVFAPMFLYRLQVLDGIDGTLVLDVDTSVISSGSATSFTAVTGQTVTINRSTSGRKSVALVHPVWLFGTDDFIRVSDDDRLDIGDTSEATIIAVIRQFTTPTNYGTIISKIENDSGTQPGWDIRGFQTQQAVQALYVNPSGIGTLNEISATESNGELRVVGMRVDRSTNLMQAFSNDAFTNGDSLTSATSIANTADLVIGATNTGDLIDMELIAAAYFPRPLSAADIAQVTAYYQARLS